MSRAWKIFYWTFAALIIFALWFAYNHPDWIVAGPPKDFRLAVATPRAAAITAGPAQPQAAQETTRPADLPRSTTPHQKQPEKPKPAPSGRPDDAQYDVTAGGFENRCYYLGPDYPGDVLYTTVIMSGYDPNDHTTFPYQGELDDHNAPATAAGSQAWCEANDPYKAER